MLHRRAFAGLVIGSGLAMTIKSAMAATVEVSMTNESRFDPDPVTIKAGDTVSWTNPAVVSHSVTFDPSMAKDPKNVALPAGVAPFDSGELMQDQTFSHQFTVKGTYKYVCKYHEEMGMKGTVIVS